MLADRGLLDDCAGWGMGPRRGAEPGSLVLLDERDAFAQHLDARARPRRVLRQVAAKGTGMGLAVTETEDVAGDVVEPPAPPQVLFDVGYQRLEHGAPGGRRWAIAKQLAVDVGEQVGILVGRAANRDPVHLCELSC